MDSRRTRPEQLSRFSWLLLALCLVGAPGEAQTIEEAIELHLAGHLDQALEAYRAVASANESSDPAVAAAAHTNACLIRMNRSEYQSALELCEAALRLRRRIDDSPRLARTLNNLGLTLQNLGRYEESRDRFLEALEINRQSGDALSSAQNLGNLSGLAIQAGTYGEALERIAQVIALTDAHAEAEWRTSQRRIAFLNRGVVLEKLGAFRAALASYRHALAEEGAVEPGLEALLKVNLGVVYRNLGDPVRALELFEEAAAAYRRLDQPSGLSNALLNIALARHLNLEEPAAAELAYREALELARRAGDRPEEIQDLFYLASLLLEQGRLDEAEELFDGALSVAEASGSAEGRWSALTGLGRTAAARNQPAAAARLFERALDVIEEVRAELAPESYRADFFGDKRGVFEAAVQAVIDLHRREPDAGHDAEAFRLVQRAKARELLDALGDERAGGPRSSAEIAGGLESDLIVEYFVAERDLVRWALDRGGLRMHIVGPASPVLATVVRVHRALSGGRAPAPAELERLADELLGSLELPADGALHIAPDGALRYLAFELLPWPAGEEQMVLDHLPVDYLPSASALSASPPGPRPALQAVALANPRLSSGGPAPLPAELIAARFGLRDLPAAEEELASLERWLGGPNLLLRGEDATKRAFRDAVRDGARVVHLATHAVIDERPGRGSAVLLAPGEADDGLLYPREIAALDLRSHLAVLAACRTALGEGSAGDSLATLTGAFLAAGARSVLATLWDVEDRATAAFMDQFYWHLGRGISPAEALRRAKQTFRSRPEWRSPHLWAGYVLTGSAPPVVNAGGLGRWLLGGAIALAAAILYLRRRRR